MHILNAVGIAGVALLLVLAAGRWLLRPLFLMIASVRSPELFSLAVLLAVLASAWATQAAGLSLAFVSGFMADSSPLFAASSSLSFAIGETTPLARTAR